MSEHTKEPWRTGRQGSVVADEPVPEISGSEDVAYYGGHLVAESVAPRNVRRIVACVNACAGLTTEFLEAPDLSFAPAHTAAKMTEIELERDQLLAALKKARLALAAASSRAPEFKADYEAADKAIAAVEAP